MSELLLECSGLSKAYQSRQVLSDINLKIEKGRIIGLLGPNGSGKTTLIKLIMGLLTRDAGEISLLGNPVGIETNKLISYLPDRTYLNEAQKVKEVIAYFSSFYDDFREDIAYKMLENLDIEPNMRLKSMSKGTKEKVQLILVMSRRAQLYILDEPIAGVDPAARDYIIKTILNNYDEEASIIISTHLISDVENILDEVIFLKNGEIVAFDSVESLREEKGKSIDAIFREEFKC